MALVTYAQATRQLRITGDEYQDDILMKMEEASAIVLDYLKIAEADVTWTDQTDPAEDRRFAIVQAAILEVLSSLFSDRGDREKPIDGPISARVATMLHRLRDPALA
jgi:hypothetical protein